MINEIKTVRKICLSLLCLTAVFMAPASFAGDEDMSPNAYHIFDPETGYMITVESVPEGQQASPEADVVIARESQADRVEISTEPRFWTYLLIAILIAGGLAAWKRSRDRISTTDS